MAATDCPVRVFDRALDWFVSNLELFDPFMRDADEPDTFYGKPLLELACLCMLYKRCAGLHRDPRIHRVASFIHSIWQRLEYRERLPRCPEMLLVYGMTWVALERYGLGESTDREVFQRVIDEGYAIAVEKPPFRCLDLRCMLDCGGFRHNLPSYASLYRRTLLAKGPSVLYLTDTDVYAITHTIFYLSDFGSRSFEGILQNQLPTVRWMVGALLGLYIRKKNWDLVAELLICCQCLRWRPDFVFDVAWNALADTQLADGIIPGPHFSAEKMKDLGVPEQKTYYLKENYHTTLVSALAAVLNDGVGVTSGN